VCPAKIDTQLECLTSHLETYIEKTMVGTISFEVKVSKQKTENHCGSILCKLLKTQR